MKVKSTLFLFAIFSLLAVSSCQKELADDHIPYLGQWGSNEYSFEIWKNGRGVYQRQNQDAQECNVIFKNNQIRFRSGAILIKKFDITVEPFTDGTGITKMILDSETFYKH